MSSIFETAVIEQAINRLFNQRSSFSICDVDNIGKMIGVNPESHPNYKYLRALHCVDYSGMSPEILKALPMKVAECFRPAGHVNAAAFLLEISREGGDTFPTEDRFLLN